MQPKKKEIKKLLGGESVNIKNKGECTFVQYVSKINPNTGKKSKNEFGMKVVLPNGKLDIVWVTNES